MIFALGMIQVREVPTTLEVVDAMCKAARVTCVGFENTALGHLIRAALAEAQAPITTGLDVIATMTGGEGQAVHLIAKADENLEFVLPIGQHPNLEIFDRMIRFPPP